MTPDTALRASARSGVIWALSLGAGAVVLVWLIGTGAGLQASVLATGALALQTVSGALVWRWFTRRRATQAEWVESLGMGFAIGSALALFAGLALRPLTLWGWILPSVVVLVWWIVLRLRRSDHPGVASSSSSTVSWRAVIGAGVAVVVGLAAAYVNLARYPLTATTTSSGYHPDMLFFEGLSDSLAYYPPWDSIFAPGAWVHYHWFAFAWSGQLSTSLGLQPFVGLTRVLPVIVVLAASAVAAAWTARRTTAAWAPGLAALLVTMGGFLGAAYGTLLNVDSPSQALSSVWLLALAYVLIEYVDGSLGRRGLTLIGLLVVVAMGSKLTSAAVLTAALAIAWVIGAVLRQPWAKRALAALAVSVVLSVVVYVLVLSGAASSGYLRLFTTEFRASTVQGLDVSYAPWGIVLGSIMLVLAVMPRWAGVVGLWLDPQTRRSSSSALAIGLVVCGAVPVLILSQGVNELWFALAASVPLSVLSAIGLAQWWQRWKSPRVLTVSVIAGVIVLAVTTFIWSRGMTNEVTIRAIGPVVGWVLAAIIAIPISRRLGASRAVAWVMVSATILVVAAMGARMAPVAGRVGDQSATSSVADAPVAETSGESPSTTEVSNQADAGFGNVWGPLEEEAAQWLTAHTGVEDAIVTDRTISALVPALTSRRTYLSSATLLSDYAGRQMSEAVPVFERISRRFGVAPTLDDYLEMCRAGVTHGWYTTGLSDDPGGEYANVAFANDAVTIIEIDRSRCP